MISTRTTDAYQAPTAPVVTTMASRNVFDADACAAEMFATYDLGKSGLDWKGIEQGQSIFSSAMADACDHPEELRRRFCAIAEAMPNDLDDRRINNAFFAMTGRSIERPYRVGRLSAMSIQPPPIRVLFDKTQSAVASYLDNYASETISKQQNWEEVQEELASLLKLGGRHENAIQRVEQHLILKLLIAGDLNKAERLLQLKRAEELFPTANPSDDQVGIAREVHLMFRIVTGNPDKSYRLYRLLKEACKSQKMWMAESEGETLVALQMSREKNIVCLRLLSRPYGDFHGLEDIGEEPDVLFAQARKAQQELPADSEGGRAWDRALMEYRSTPASQRAQETKKMQAMLQWHNYHHHREEIPVVDTSTIPEIKKRIFNVFKENFVGLESVAKIIFRGVISEPSGSKGKPVCFLFDGPCGVGKTSMARAVAEALGRDFVEIEAQTTEGRSSLHGDREVYRNSGPGLLAEKLLQSPRPKLFLIDEIGKATRQFQQGFLQVTDDDSGTRVYDRWLNLPLDFRNTILIATKNTWEVLDPSLASRLRSVRILAPTRAQKIDICRRFWNKGSEKRLSEALRPNIDERALKLLVDVLDREDGVRPLLKGIDDLITTIQDLQITSTVPESIDRLFVARKMFGDIWCEKLLRYDGSLFEDGNKSKPFSFTSSLSRCLAAHENPDDADGLIVETSLKGMGSAAKFEVISVPSEHFIQSIQADKNGFSVCWKNSFKSYSAEMLILDHQDEPVYAAIFYLWKKETRKPNRYGRGRGWPEVEQQPSQQADPSGDESTDELRVSWKDGLSELFPDFGDGWSRLLELAKASADQRTVRVRLLFWNGLSRSRFAQYQNLHAERLFLEFWPTLPDFETEVRLARQKVLLEE